MPTSFKYVFSRFLSKISDYEWAAYSDEDLSADLKDYLSSAISEFMFCKQDLSVTDMSKRQFPFDLTNVEIELLTDYMVVRWLDAKFINRQTLLKQNLPSRDFNVYSPANHLEKLYALRDSTIDRIERRRAAYTYDNFRASDYVRKR